MSGRTSGVVIVGGGAAGNACAATLRKQGFGGRVRVVDAEPDHPINRTLVDTGVLPGLLTPSQLALPRVEGIEIIAGRAVEIHAGVRRITLADGTELSADALVLACGSSPRGLDAAVSVADGAPVHWLHTAADAVALREALPDRTNARIAILGSGFIAAEAASLFVAQGAEVVLLGRSAQPLRAAVGPRIAERLAELHRERVDARFGSVLHAVESGTNGRALALTLGDGSGLEVDALVVAQVTVPATGWAGHEAGIRVDASLRVVGEAAVYAAGSAALLDTDQGPVRIDHWDDAAAQGSHAARAVLADLCGAEEPGAYVPRTGFTLQAYGSVIAAKGLRGSHGSERDADEHLDVTVPPRPSGLLTEFLHPDGSLSGVAGMNAGAAVARRAAGIGS